MVKFTLLECAAKTTGKEEIWEVGNQLEKEKGFRKQQWLQAAEESKMRIMWARRAGAQDRHPGLVLCVCVMGRCPHGISEILRTFCPEGWNFDKCSLPKPASSEDPGSFAIDFNGSRFGPSLRPLQN